jgi:hypothetical protein
VLSYRAHFDVAREAVRDVALEQFGVWLRGKGYDADALTSDHDRKIRQVPEARMRPGGSWHGGRGCCRLGRSAWWFAGQRGGGAAATTSKVSHWRYRWIRPTGDLIVYRCCSMRTL